MRSNRETVRREKFKTSFRQFQCFFHFFQCGYYVIALIALNLRRLSRKWWNDTCCIHAVYPRAYCCFQPSTSVGRIMCTFRIQKKKNFAAWKLQLHATKRELLSRKIEELLTRNHHCRRMTPINVTIFLQTSSIDLRHSKTDDHRQGSQYLYSDPDTVDRQPSVPHCCTNQSEHPKCRCVVLPMDQSGCTCLNVETRVQVSARRKRKYKSHQVGLVERASNNMRLWQQIKSW